jgi:hypothetical protein
MYAKITIKCTVTVARYYHMVQLSVVLNNGQTYDPATITCVVDPKGATPVGIDKEPR